MTDELTIFQWNVRGLKDQNQASRLKTWIRKMKNESSMICIQETKIKKTKLEFQLKVIDLEAMLVIDGDACGRVGAVIMIPKGFRVTDMGTKGDGSFAWVTMCTNRGSVGGVFLCPK